MALETNETGNLIGSDKVEGTAVYGADRNKIGSIERVMIDKISGRVSYAVLGFGGLRVADASVFPFVTRANTNITAILVGEKIAEAMR